MKKYLIFAGEFEVWLRYHLSTCGRRELQGYSNHMLYIGRKV